MIVARVVVRVVDNRPVLCAVKTLGGPCLLDRCCMVCRDTQEEHLWNLILRRSDVDDGASCDAASARYVHA